MTRTDNSFRAELRGLAARLDQPTGRVYGRRCDARLGDGRCGVSLAAFKAMGEIVAADTLQASVSGISGFASGWFAFGVLTFTSGTLAGRAVDIGGHQAGDPARLSFWLPLPESAMPGDTFEIVAGCDKAFSTCRAKFGNALNFQGFPHMPGSDFAYSYVSGATHMTGRCWWRELASSALEDVLLPAGEEATSTSWLQPNVGNRRLWLSVLPSGGSRAY